MMNGMSRQQLIEVSDPSVLENERLLNLSIEDLRAEIFTAYSSMEKRILKLEKSVDDLVYRLHNRTEKAE